MSEAQHWSSQFIGRLWAPEFNCWGLARLAIRCQHLVDLPNLDDPSELMREAHAAGFERTFSQPIDGDVLLCRDLRGQRHVGMVVKLVRRLHLLHNDGHMTPSGPTGSVVRPRLADVIVAEPQFWRKTA